MDDFGLVGLTPGARFVLRGRNRVSFQPIEVAVLLLRIDFLLCAIIPVPMRAIRFLLVTAILVVSPTGVSQTFHPDIPRTWATKDVADVEIPLAQPDRSPRYLSEKEYYALKVRPIYRSYPAYAEGREPAGYIESLKQKAS